MHKESLEIMKVFSRMLDKEKQISILDIGSFNVNGCYKDIFSGANWRYVGADIVLGPNVDIVLGFPWAIEDGSFDVVISGQTLEHVFDPLSWMKEAYRVLKKNGTAMIIAPSSGPEHGEAHFKDYWRILPDGMRGLMVAAGFKDVKVNKGHGRWGDCAGMGFKY